MAWLASFCRSTIAVRLGLVICRSSGGGAALCRAMQDTRCCRHAQSRRPVLRTAGPGEASGMAASS